MKYRVPFLLFTMKLSSLFENRAYVINNKTSSNLEDIELINTILINLKKPIKPSSIEFISINDDYDTYKVVSDEGLSFCVKVSLDENCDSINKESKIIRNINELIRPGYIEDGIIKIGDNLRYIITSFEESESLNQIGRSFLLDNFDSFCYSYKLLQEEKNINFNYKDRLDLVFQKIEIENYFTKDAINAIKNYTDFKTIKSFLFEIKNEIINTYDPSFDKYKNICHGNLKMSTIISNKNLFKFINFENSFNCHIFSDLSNLTIQLGLPENLDLYILKEFCKNLNIEYSVSTNQLYQKFYYISLCENVIHMTVDYLKEVYVYSSLRTDKIIDISNRFSFAYERFFKIKSFNKFHSFIMKTITEPILGQKA